MTLDRKRVVESLTDEGHSRKSFDLSLTKATAGQIRQGTLSEGEASVPLTSLLG